MNSRAYERHSEEPHREPQNLSRTQSLRKRQEKLLEDLLSDPGLLGVNINRTTCDLLQPHSTIHENDGHDINWQSDYLCPHCVQKFEYFPLIKERGSPKQTRGSTKNMKLTSKGNRDRFKMLQRNLLKCPLIVPYKTRMSKSIDELE